jgi:hypothetical protein
VKTDTVEWDDALCDLKRREGLVRGHLERVSRDLLDNHPEAVKEFIGQNPGVYALYRKDKLYYVGLATKLRNRLKSHGKNQTANRGTGFQFTSP